MQYVWQRVKYLKKQLEFLAPFESKFEFENPGFELNNNNYCYSLPYIGGGSEYNSLYGGERKSLTTSLPFYEESEDMGFYYPYVNKTSLPVFGASEEKEYYNYYYPYEKKTPFTMGKSWTGIEKKQVFPVIGGAGAGLFFEEGKMVNEVLGGMMGLLKVKEVECPVYGEDSWLNGLLRF